MIVSFDRKFIFVAVPKTASQSLRAALRPLMGAQDWEQCKRFQNKNMPIEQLARLRHGHLTCRQVIPHLQDRGWDDFFSFAIVRNPFDRFVSFNAFINRGIGRMDRDPLGTMKRSLRDVRQLLSIHMRPQNEFITDKRGDILVDYVGRFEDIQNECDIILERLGSARVELPKINSSNRNHYRDYFDDELREMVTERYATDLALFGYSFDETD